MLHPYVLEIQENIDCHIHPLHWRPPATVAESKALLESMPDVYARFQPCDEVIQNCPEFVFLRNPWKERFRNAIKSDSAFRRDVLISLTTDPAFAKAVLDAVRGCTWGTEDQY